MLKYKNKNKCNNMYVTEAVLHYVSEKSAREIDLKLT